MMLEGELKALKWERKDDMYLVKNLRKLILWFDHQHAFNQTEIVKQEDCSCPINAGN